MFHHDYVEKPIDQVKCVAMPKMRRKADLPQKTCATCGKPFAWRKKWAKVWDEVRYCSERCKTNRKSA
jgi:hypothetical protein